MSRLAYSHLTKRVYLIKGNNQREDLTNHFLQFLDEVLPVKDDTVQDVVDALGLVLPPERTLPTKVGRLRVSGGKKGGGAK